MKNITAPTVENEQELNALMGDIPETVVMDGRKYRIGSLRNGAIRKLTNIVLSAKDDSKVTAKCVAVITLGRFWKIKLWYWLVWRWFYYIKETPEHEMTALIETAKKKLPSIAYYRNTISLIGIKDTSMMMTRKETEAAVNHIRQGRHGEAPPTSARTTSG